MIKHIRPLWNQGSKSGVYWSGLHDSHDLIEENPVGQPCVTSSGTLWHRVHLHVVAVERNAVLPLHHLLKQLNLWQQKQSCFFFKQGEGGWWSVGWRTHFHTGSCLNQNTCSDRWDLSFHSEKHFTVTGSQTGLQPSACFALSPSVVPV